MRLTRLLTTTMLALLMLLLLAPTCLWAQSGNTVTIPFAGVPTGTCAFPLRGYNLATGDLYWCQLGVWAKLNGGGGGGGTVTTFSAGDLAPLFTSSVANATTTPALTFTFSTAANKTFLGNHSGGVAAPSYIQPACGDLSDSGTLCLSSAALPANTTATAHNFFTAYNSTTGAFTKAQPAVADLSDATSVGGVGSCGANQYATATTTGAPTCAQVAYTQVSGTPTLPATKTAATGQPLLSYDAATGLFTQGALTATNVGLGSVTNDAQTKAAIVPNTAPSAGQVLVGNAGGTAYAPQTLSGSGATATLSSAGVLTVSSVALASLSTQAADTVVANATGGAAAPTAVTIGSCSTASSALTYSTSSHAFGCNSISGAGTVTVVSSGALTSTALVTGGGTTTLQTPSATSTLDASGNASFPGSVAVTATGGGFLQLTQGTAPSAGTTAINIAAPASVTSYNLILPGASATGLVRRANAANVDTESIAELSGDCATSGSNVVTCTQINGSNFTVNTSGLPTKVDGITTAGQGVAIVQCITSAKTETGADATLLSCTPAAAVGSYEVCISLDVSAATSATLGWTMTWTNSKGNANAPTNIALFQMGVAAPAVTFTAAANNSYYQCVPIAVNNAGTAIVVKTTFSGTSIAYNATATIRRII